MKLLVNRNVLGQCEGAIGSTQYRHLWFEDHGVQKDIVEDGELCCAYFMSSVLHNHDLLRSVHATVKGTIADMMTSGWTMIDLPQIGAILHWEEFEGHEHIGIFVGDDKAISHSDKTRSPQKHDWLLRSEQFPEGRALLGILWHEKLKS
ncbi:MAG: hypothetical protein UZ21_OP11001000702 [Microgenomates bacterium OLB22]|nr:MAG: hypothetical protein UZ21_OP11001000702 [Microgenomates bacterium OLB22]